MNSLYIKDFRFGLDTRKSELTQNPGSLEVLNNGFVNQGGEIENRKAFVRTARVANTFGLQATAAGLYTFGSIAAPGAHTAPGLNIGTGPIPIYVLYQRLQHPAVLFDVALYNAALHDMFVVTFSTQFRGKAVVAARFDDGNTFAYYDGSLMLDFTDGLLMAHLSTNTLIATEIKNMINRATDLSGISATSSTNTVVVSGIKGESYQISATKNDLASGDISVLVSNDPEGSTVAKAGSGSFSITSGSFFAGTNKISKVESQLVIVRNTLTRARVNATSVATLAIGTGHGITAGMELRVTGIPGYNIAGGTVLGAPDAPTATTVSYTVGGTVNEGTTADTSGIVIAGTPVVITNGAVDWTESNANTARLVAQSINANTGNGFTAKSSGSEVFIYSPVSDGDGANTFEVRVTAAGNVCCCTGGFSFVGVGLSVTTLSVDGVDIKTVPYLAFPVATAPTVEFATISAMVSALAANINANSAVSGYLAFASGSKILISRVVTSSYDPNVNMICTINGAGGVGTPPAGSGVAFITDLNNTTVPLFEVSVALISFANLDRGRYSGVTMKTTVTGGNPGFLYLWTYTPNPSHPTRALTGLTTDTLYYEKAAGYPVSLYCTVTDSLGRSVNSPVTIG